jgi:zinc/manganese transport system substrate-binding protein/manganese/iron transport system substrate-binding protein
MRISAGVLALLLAVGAGCSSEVPSAEVNVVATTTVFADLVASVGGNRVSVTSLVPKGAEAHTFDPAPSDAVLLEHADLIVMNGLGLDDWLRPFASSAGAGSVPVLELARRISSVEWIDDNPHLWLNPDYGVAYAEHIALALTELDPVGADLYETRLLTFTNAVFDMDGQVLSRFSALPTERRRVVSFHDAFPYFADHYGLEVVDVIVDAPGQDPTPAEVARLIEAIRSSGARVILAEAQFGDELAQTIAAEAGVEVVRDLYTDSLGDPPVDSYLGAMRWNVDQVVKALE